MTQLQALIGCGLLISAVAFTSGCTTAEHAAEAKQEEINREYNYPAMVDKFTKGDAQYDGFYVLFQYQATLLNTSMLEAQLRKRGVLQLWDEQKLQQERNRKVQDLTGKTELFVSFFSPQRDITNLDSKKTQWRVYLDVDGRRYIGDVKKFLFPLTDILALYPYHNRWSTAYIVTFPVATVEVEKHQARLTMTGSLGTSSVLFPTL